MAGRRPAANQRPIDFDYAEADARAAYRERNSELRAKLRSIDPAPFGLTPRQWQQVCEVLMSVWAHTNTTSKTRPQATTCLTGTAGLTARQFRSARGLAVRFNLLMAVRTYDGPRRSTDRLEVDVGAVDRLVAATRAGLQPGSSLAATWLQPGRSSTVSPVRARARLLKDLPITSSSSSTSATLTSSATKPKTEEVEEVGVLLGRIRRKLPAPLRVADAVHQAIAAGCTVGQLTERCRWFYHHQGDWQREHRSGVLYIGLSEATPDMRDEDGWPYRK